uniref:Uncharacterized protein n=1 Tax=Plectus sambesii TaxID=2011161 RepID=A0A914V1Y5_9BILA
MTILLWAAAVVLLLVVVFYLGMTYQPIGPTTDAANPSKIRRSSSKRDSSGRHRHRSHSSHDRHRSQHKSPASGRTPTAPFADVLVDRTATPGADQQPPAEGVGSARKHSSSPHRQSSRRRHRPRSEASASGRTASMISAAIDDEEFGKRIGTPAEHLRRHSSRHRSRTPVNPKPEGGHMRTSDKNESINV